MHAFAKLVVVAGGVLVAGVAASAEEGLEIVLKGIKPTLTGYANNAFVECDKVGREKKEMTVFRRNKKIESPLVAAVGGQVWGDQVGFSFGGVKKLSGDAHLAVDADSGFTGNLDYDGSTYTFLGNVRLVKHLFASDVKDPLVFKLVKHKGFVYLKGKGTVTLPDGVTVTISATGK